MKSRTQRKTPSRRITRPSRRRAPPPKPIVRFKWQWLLFLLLLIPTGSYVSWLDVQVREQFEGKRWALPARVYAQPLELYEDMSLKPETLAEELQVLGYQAVELFDSPGQYKRQGNVFYIMTRAFRFWDSDEPSRMLEVHFKGQKIGAIRETHPDRKLALVRLEPRLIGKIYPTHHEDRVLVKLADVPDLLIDALLAMEDRNFYNHFGVSIRGVVRASVENLKAGNWVQGGSTITQQLIKNLYLTPERTFGRKFNEAIMALLLEWHYSKEEILEAYLNEVYLGQDGDRAIHGMGMAARFYFNRPIDELNLTQIALLVSLIRAASHYNPRKHPERALDRRNLVLDIMVKQGVITTMEAEVAKIDPLNIVEEPTETHFPYPAFMGLVQHQLSEDYREEDLRSEGLRIFTTLDPVIQKLADKNMITSLKQLERRQRQARNLEGAMVITNSTNGEVLALANGKNPHFAGFNRPLNAKRQIGSLVKVAVYLTALESAGAYSLTTSLDDAPYQWIDRNTGEVWKPQNYDYRSHGQVPLFRALANSYNLATVRLGMKLGLDSVQETMHRMGLEREFKMYPSVLLGSIGLTPIEVTQMYQTIANNGFRTPLRAIREVLTHTGEPLQRYSLSIEPSFDPAAVFLLNYAMQQVVRKGTGKKLGRLFPKSMVIAGKTGTSNDLRDSWFAGFTTELLAVTWVGRDDNKPMGLSGGSGAMYIWGQFMKKMTRPKVVAPSMPQQIQWQWVNAHSGRPSNRHNPGAIRVPFFSGTNINAQLRLGR